MNINRNELLVRRVDIFNRINGLIHELVRHHKMGLLDKDNAKIIAAMFTKTVSISPQEFVYLIKCLREELEEYFSSEEESSWREVKKLAHEIAVHILRVQYFVDALLIEAESSSESIMAKLEFRRLYGNLVGKLIEDVYEWCYELKSEERII